YVFTDTPISEQFLFFTANELYSPSYISLESALSWYGFIPEGVFQITSCSTRKTQTFHTGLRNFSYRQIKSELFFAYQLEKWNNHYIAIAEPEKTVIDYLYLHHEIAETGDFASLRWNSTEMVSNLSFD